ncbi:class I SAM-dependent methyltransferase [Amycolatopsis samaneae]|uniref:Class I SAM-dependent methyltransferase n=1 Tax=Amycolatopsis samaneae TaxID=664691 RepID=A0ABW5GMG8_9PSEU
MTTRQAWSLTDLYGYAYHRAEQAGPRPGAVRMIYQDAGGDGFAEDVANYFAPPERWWHTDVLACELARGRVLDVGCGAGRHAVQVAKAGHEVVGLEPSWDAVGVARRRGVDARCGRLPALPPDLGRFDTFLLAGGGLHLLRIADEHGSTLDRFTEAAEPGARVVGTMMSTEAGESARPYRMRVQHEGTLTGWSEWSGTNVGLPAAELPAVLEGTGWTVDQVRHHEETARVHPLTPRQFEAMDRGLPWDPPADAACSLTAPSYLAVLRLTTG